jgi:hypothetical protein
MIGDLFFDEPVGRIVRRAKVVVTDGMTQLKNAYPGAEFIRSTDPPSVGLHRQRAGRHVATDGHTRASSRTRSSWARAPTFGARPISISSTSCTITDASGASARG